MGDETYAMLNSDQQQCYQIINDISSEASCKYANYVITCNIMSSVDLTEEETKCCEIIGHVCWKAVQKYVDHIVKVKNDVSKIASKVHLPPNDTGFCPPIETGYEWKSKIYRSFDLTDLITTYKEKGENYMMMELGLNLDKPIAYNFLTENDFCGNEMIFITFRPNHNYDPKYFIQSTSPLRKFLNAYGVRRGFIVLVDQ